MLGYYGQLLRKLPATLMDAASRWLTVAALAFAVLAWLGLAEGTDIPPWLALIPVALLAIHGLMRANYDALAEAREKAARTDAAEEHVRLLREEVQTWQQRYNVSQAQYEVFRDLFDEEEKQGRR